MNNLLIEQLGQFNQVDIDILITLNENIIMQNEFLEKIYNLLYSLRIPIFLIIFSLALLVSLIMFKD